MPFQDSTYTAPAWLPGSHLQTLVPRYSRSLKTRRIYRQAQPVVIDLSDGDQLYADLYTPGQSVSSALLILSHGLEGCARSGYILGMVRAALARSWSVLAWNMRSCGPRLNPGPGIYHSGASGDLHQVIHWARRGGWQALYLAGFSLGGNLTLKWLGEQGTKAQALGVVAAATASVPLDLKTCVRVLERPVNRLYHHYFVRSMKRRLRLKAAQHPDHYDLKPLPGLRTLWQLDNEYTAPLNGFRDACDYYARCSAAAYLQSIEVPCLLVTAANDPFFDRSCYPQTQAADSAWLTFEAPAEGGHVGFWQGPGRWWLEERFLDYMAGHHAS